MIRSSLMVMMFTLLSRILGLVRTVFIASVFGAGYLSDAYISSFKISNLFRQLLGEGALGTVFIPNYNEKVEKEGEEKASSLIFSILFLLFIFLLVVSTVFIIFSSSIINFIVRGYSVETKILASKLLRISSIYFIFIGLAGMVSAILNNYKKFAMPAFMPVMFNLSIISCGFLFYKKIGVYSLVIGLVIGGFFQLAVLLPQFLLKVRKFEFKIDFKDPYLRKVFFMMLPMLIGIVARQINTIVDQYFASSLQTGTVSAMEYATRLYNLPLGMFGISIATVIYPDLSKAIEKKEFEKVRKFIEKGLKFLLFLIIPSVFVLYFLSDDVVKIVLGYGKFSNKGIVLTSESLAFYSIGLYFYSSIHILSRAYYGMKDTKKPVIFSVLSIVINIILNYLLVREYKHIGLALATSIASVFNFIMLYIYFNKRYIKIKSFNLLKFLSITILVSVIGLVSALNFENSILRLGVFSLIYLLLWLYPFMKKGVALFE